MDKKISSRASPPRREERWTRPSPPIPYAPCADPPLVDDAAELLSSAPLHAIVYGFSSSYVRGAADDTRLRERLERRARGIPVVITCAAVVTALIAHRATRLALISPPWFSAEMDQQGVRYFRARLCHRAFGG